jgi:transposase
MTIRIGNIDNIINGEMAEYEEAIKRLDEIPGVGERTAQVILAEIGLDMSRFPTASHLAFDEKPAIC